MNHKDNSENKNKSDKNQKLIVYQISEWRQVWKHIYNGVVGRMKDSLVSIENEKWECGKDNKRILWAI